LCAGASNAGITTQSYTDKFQNIDVISMPESRLYIQVPESYKIDISAATNHYVTTKQYLNTYL
jgi:hypothetical protein